MTWAGYTVVFTMFFATHSIPVRPAIKSRITARIGARAFGIGYSILSVAMLALLIRAAGEAPYVELWSQLPWHRHVVHLGMLTACLILAFAIARPNPFSFGGMRNDKFDPAHPGIVRLIRHPVLGALTLWAGLHLLPNGDLAHVLLFGVLGGFAVVGRGLINRRKRREMEPKNWDQLNRAMNQAPLLNPPHSWSGAILRSMAGIALFTAMIALHPTVIGVSAI